MEFLSSVFMLIVQFFVSIFYYLFGFFFLAEPPATSILKLFLLAQVILLVHTSFHPTKWKWTTLFVTETVLVLSGIAVFVFGIAEDNLGIMGYGIVSGAWGFVMLVATLICNSRAPFVLKKARRNSSPAPADETPEN